MVDQLYDVFYDVVYVSEVVLDFVGIGYLDFVFLCDGMGEFVYCYVGLVLGVVDGEEVQVCGG